jgi:GT2 family glycosyltransferase
MRIIAGSGRLFLHGAQNMTEPIVSVIIPTRNRPGRLSQTLRALNGQDVPAHYYETIVVDDGSMPPVVVPETGSGPRQRVVRLEGSERSASRNAGAAVARGKVLVFIDDDITVARDFIYSHLYAHRKWPEALVVGSIKLPAEAMAKPFAKFRQTIDDASIPRIPGRAQGRNLCAAGNMSISRDLFHEIGGFDPNLVSGEDQDFALRHTALGRKIVFWPRARAVHEDNALDIRSYCRRAEWGSKHLVPFCRRHPNWPDNIERERVNSHLCWSRDPISLTLRKLIKGILALPPFREALFLTTSVLERTAPGSSTLDLMYRVLLGVHIRRGYREGVARYDSQLSERRLAARPSAAD